MNIGLESITFDQVNEFLARRDAEHPCEACGDTNWMVHAQDFEQIVFLDMPFSFDASRGYSFMPLFCNTCGNTRFFSADVMVRDILQHSATPPRDSSDG